MGGKRHVWLGTLRIRFGLVHQITYLSSPQPTQKAVLSFRSLGQDQFAKEAMV